MIRLSAAVPFHRVLFNKNALVQRFQQNHRLSRVDWHKEQDVATSRGWRGEGVGWSLCLWTPELLLCLTMRAFEVSSPVWTLPSVDVLKRTEPSGLHVIVVILFNLLPFLRELFQGEPNAFNLTPFHFWIIWRWPLTFSQDACRVIDRFSSVVLVSVESFVFSNPNATLINLLMLIVPHLNLSY